MFFDTLRLLFKRSLLYNHYILFTSVWFGHLHFVHSGVADVDEAVEQTVVVGFGEVCAVAQLNLVWLVGAVVEDLRLFVEPFYEAVQLFL